MAIVAIPDYYWFCHVPKIVVALLTLVLKGLLPGMDTPWDCSWTRALRHPLLRSVTWREPTRECLLGKKILNLEDKFSTKNAYLRHDQELEKVE